MASRSSTSSWSEYFDGNYGEECLKEHESVKGLGFEGSFNGRYNYCKNTLHRLPEQRQSITETIHSQFSTNITFHSNDWLSKIHNKLRGSVTYSSLTPTYDSLKSKNRKVQIELESRRKAQTYSLPQLPQNTQTIINEACKQPATNILVEKYGYFVTVASLKTLIGTCWLTDEIINFYFQLTAHHIDSNQSKIYVFNSFFFTKLKDKGFDGVKRWTKNVDLFSYDKILLPIHLGMHWCTALIDFRRRSIFYYDSLHGQNISCLQLLLSYINSEAIDKNNILFNANDWSLVHVSDCPEQQNGYDCGVFCCVFANCLVNNLIMSFSQKDMPYFRKKIAYEIITQKILD